MTRTKYVAYAITIAVIAVLTVIVSGVPAVGAAPPAVQQLQTASDTYRAYLRSWPGWLLNPSGSLDAISADSPLRESRLAQFPQMAAFFTGLVGVEFGPERGSGPRRTFTATGTVDNRKVRGTITMVLEKGGWKIETEEWQPEAPPPTPKETAATVMRLAAEETAAAKSHCEQNYTLGNLYDCACYRDAVANYRTKIGTDVDDRGAFKTSYPAMMLDRGFDAAIGRCAAPEKIHEHARQLALRISRLRRMPDDQANAYADCVGKSVTASFLKAPRASADYVGRLGVEAGSACDRQ